MAGGSRLAVSLMTPPLSRGSWLSPLGVLPPVLHDHPAERRYFHVSRAPERPPLRCGDEAAIAQISKLVLVEVAAGVFGNERRLRIVVYRLQQVELARTDLRGQGSHDVLSGA